MWKRKFWITRPLAKTSPRFVAPELKSSPPQHTQQSNVFSLGVVIWELLTLKSSETEFVSKNALEIPSTITAEQQQLIFDCWKLTLQIGHQQRCGNCSRETTRARNNHANREGSEFVPASRGTEICSGKYGKVLSGTLGAAPIAMHSLSFVQGQGLKEKIMKETTLFRKLRHPNLLSFNWCGTEREWTGWLV